MRAPQLHVPHPGPKSRAHLERLRRLEGRAALSVGLSPEAVVMERALGASIEDVDGNVFLDFVAGFGSLNAGHCHPRVVEAIREQAGKVHQAMSTASGPRTDLLEKVLTGRSMPEKRRKSENAPIPSKTCLRRYTLGSEMRM